LPDPLLTMTGGNKRGRLSPFDFDAAAYFAANSTGWFDAVFFDADLGIDLSSSVASRMRLGLDLEGFAMGNCTFGLAVAVEPKHNDRASRCLVQRRGARPP
jgi:hypothetical protein